MDSEIILWANIWKWVLFGGCGAFVLLIVYVIVFGAGDVKKLFASLGGQDTEDSQSETES